MTDAIIAIMQEELANTGTQFELHLWQQSGRFDKIAVYRCGYYICNIGVGNGLLIFANPLGKSPNRFKIINLSNPECFSILSKNIINSLLY